MDIISASNIGMTNAYKGKNKMDKQAKKDKGKVYILAEINYMVDGTMGNNTIGIYVCNEETLIDIAKEYYEERGLRRNRKWEDININKITVKEAIKILTKRKYASIQEINKVIVENQLLKNRLVELIEVDDYIWQSKEV